MVLCEGLVGVEIGFALSPLLSSVRFRLSI